MNTQQLAAQFAAGKRGTSHNAKVITLINGADEYTLHGYTIAKVAEGCSIKFDWCGWYTSTTARHMNAILKAAGSDKRVSYAAAKKAGETTFTVVLL